MTDELTKQIANIFFAVAKADKKLSFEEYVKISEVLDKKWKHVVNIDIKLLKEHFNDLQKKNEPASECFDNFVKFLGKNPTIFTAELKALILSSANAIAHASSKLNKSELVYIAKLDLEMKKLSQ